ncbi:MAG TPA: tetratricopeptide repeat protein [Candidatus Eisenbacteria bacterium]|jgi:putative thioredoxin
MSHEVTDFERDVIERSRSIPVLVDFWAEWCGPCRVLGPIIERVAGDADGRWELAKVDTEAHPGITERFGIYGIPAVKLFVNGEVVDEFVGLMPEDEIRRWLESALPSPQDAAVAAARELLGRGSYAQAIEALRGVLAAEPHNAEARLALAEALLRVNPAEVEATLRDVGDDPGSADRAEALIALARLATTAERPGDLPDTAAKEPLLAGARAIRSGDYGAALEALIESLRRDRRYAGGAAQDAGRAIFVVLGIHHPISELYHRAFSSAVLA